MTITVGTWVVPLIVTIFSLTVAVYSTPQGRGDYGYIGAGLVGVIYLAGAVILSLIAWLIWAVVK